MIRRGRRVETVVSWFVQLVVLAGLPLALWRLTGNPVPSRVPSWLDVQDWWAGVQLYPASALDIVPRIVADALWIAWAWYTAWTLLGLLWELLHLPGILLPRILLRLTPRTTVHAITIGAVAATPTVHAASAPAHTGQGAAPLPAHLNGRLALTSVAASPSARPGHPLDLFTPAAVHDATHRVVHGDTLWDLAVCFYGDGEAWHRIYHANLDRPQPDGARLRDPDLIQPGWTLTIPDPAIPSRIPAPPPDPPGAAPPVRRPPAPHGNRTPDATTPGAATSGPTTPAPGPTRISAPGKPGPGPASRPAAPHPPGSVGYHIPDGGYIGITLIAVVASAVALLKTRQRLNPDTTPPIPESAEHLAAVYTAARHTHAHGHHPARDNSRSSPVLFAPQPGLPALGTYPDHVHEASYPGDARTGPLLFTGPGASDAARALAVSLLGASDFDDNLPTAQNPLGVQVLLTDQKLAADLFAARPDQHLPGWLHLTATPADAAAQFHTAARRRAASGTDAENFQPTEDEPYTALLLRADPSLHDTIVQACLTDPTGSLSAVLLGPPPHDPHTTTLTFDHDGVLTDANGPRAAQISGLGIYHLSRERASELFHLLHATGAVYRQPPPDTAPPVHRPNPGSEREPAHQPAAESAPLAPEDGESSPPIISDPRTLTATPLLLRVQGPIDILGPGTSTPARGALTQALLTLLALHPRGLTTTQLADLAWDQPPQHKRAVYAALDRLRDLIRGAAPAPRENGNPAAIDPIPADHTGRYRLDPDQITTDLALQTRLEDEADRAADLTERLNLLNQAADLHRGPLADGLDDDTRDWLTTARYEQLLHTAHLHLRCADASAGIDPGDALDHVKQAAALAPDDEHIHTDAIRLYHQLGRSDLAHALARRRAT